MDEPVDVIPLAGFDPEGEPEIRMMANGCLYVVFNFMPPSWAEDHADSFDDFDRLLAQATGVTVDWEDREVFRLAQPAVNTVERIQKFLAAYRRQ